MGVLTAAAGETPQLPVLDGSVNAETWSALPANPRLIKCETDACQTLKALLASFALLDQRDFPNSMARTTSLPAASPELMPVLRKAKENSRSAADACEYLATVGRGVEDLSVVLHAIEISTWLVPFSQACSRQVANAVPETLEATPVLKEALSLCLARREANCDQLEPGRN